MDRSYYLDYFGFERNHWWFRARQTILRGYIGLHVPRGYCSRILNLGAATGSTSEMLSRFGEVVSIEYDLECIESVRDRVPVTITQGDVCDLGMEDNIFGLVCAFDVLEHINAHETAVKEMVRVCRPGGHILVTVPAHRKLWGEHDEINHHVRRYEKQEITRLFEQQGGTTEVFSTYYNSTLYWPIRLVRMFSAKHRTKNLRSDFEKYRPGLSGFFLERIFSSERNRLNRHRPFKNGVSIFAHYKKN